jgi:hypothetical protein
MDEDRKTLGDYLSEKDPLGSLWSDSTNLIFRDSPRLARLDRLNPAARAIHLVGILQGEIYNGGFSQFFSNSSGNHVHETVDALKQVGASLTLSLLERAISLFPSSIAPSDRQTRCELLFAFEAQDEQVLETLDQEFYAKVDLIRKNLQEDLRALLLAFMRANASEHVSVEP